MSLNIRKIGATFLAIGICTVHTQVRAQETTTVTTTKGAFTEFVPTSRTVVVRSETDPAPLRYAITKETTIVNQAGTPIALDQVEPGSPLSVQYTGAGGHLVASRIIVQNAPVTSEQHTTTTTTTTRPLTHEEKEAMEEQREHRRDRMKERIEKRKEALEKAEDKLDDDH